MSKDIFFIHLKEVHETADGRPYHVPYGTVAAKAVGTKLYLSAACRSRRDPFSYKIGRDISAGRLKAHLDKKAKVNPNLFFFLEGEDWSRENIIATLKHCDIRRLKGEPMLIILD